MNKNMSFILIFFFIYGLFIAAFNPVSAELFEDTWTIKTSMSSTQRIDLGVVAVEGKIYAIGGSLEGTNERYDTVTDTWVTLETMPTPRLGFAIAAYQNKIYCIGGSSSSGLLDVTEVYDITNDSWSTKTPLPVSEWFIQAHVVDGKIFVVTQLAVYVYDPVEDSWSNKINTPTQGYHAFSVVVDDKIIIVDQIPQGTYDKDYTDVAMKVMIYDPKTNVWSEGQTSPKYQIYTNGSHDWLMRPVAAGATTGVYAPQKIYVLIDLISIYVYDIAEDIWSINATVGPEHTQLIGCGIGVVDDILYVIGVTYATTYGSAGILQYVPTGHKNAVTAPEPFNPTTQSPATLEPSNTALLSTTPKQSNPPTSEPTLTYIIAAILALTIGTTVTGILYSKKKK